MLLAQRRVHCTTTMTSLSRTPPSQCRTRRTDECCSVHHECPYLTIAWHQSAPGFQSLSNVSKRLFNWPIGAFHSAHGWHLVKFHAHFGLSDSPKFHCDTVMDGRVGDSANITCSLSSNPLPQLVTWHFYIDGSHVQIDSGEFMDGYHAFEEVCEVSVTFCYNGRI